MSAPRHFHPGEGRTYALGRLTLTFKTGAEDSEGAYGLCEVIEPPQSGAGLHRHASFQETHIISEGRYEFQLGEEKLPLGPGDMVAVPKGVKHGLKSLGPETGRELIISSPGGIFEAFIAEVSGGADFHAAAARHGFEFLS